MFTGNQSDLVFKLVVRKHFWLTVSKDLILHSFFFQVVSSWYFCPYIIHEDETNKAKNVKHNQHHHTTTCRTLAVLRVLAKDQYSDLSGQKKVSFLSASHGYTSYEGHHVDCYFQNVYPEGLNLL